MIAIAHDCSVLRIPFDAGRLFDEPPGNYMLGLALVVERVSETNREQAERMEALRR